MGREKVIRFLLGAGLMSPQQAEEIAACFQPRTLEKQAFLLQAGQVSNEYLFLDHGLLRAFVHDAEGQDVTTGFYSGGHVALEVASFFNRTPSQEHLQALTACAGWFITYAQLNALFHARPEFREFGRWVLVRHLAAVKSRMLNQLTETATVRYEKLLKTNPEILLHAPLKHVASYLGITDSSLSRIRAGAKDVGPA